MLKPDRKRTNWKFKTLHRFCSDLDGVRCPDGYAPSGLTYQGAEFGLPYDGQSALYGVTGEGGTGGSGRGAGVAFQLTGAQHEFKIIYNFCPDQPDCADAGPYGLAMDSNGVLFGAALHGAIYELSPLGSFYTHAVLYEPCQPGDCANGSGYTLLTVKADGSLVGSTGGGGSCGYGTVFKLVPNTLSSQYAVLWNFCNPVEGGKWPFGKVLVGANGNFFGTVLAGGSYDGGLLYELTPDGGILYQRHIFCASNCAEGSEPSGPLIADASGNLFGTTGIGGNTNAWAGVVYELSP